MREAIDAVIARIGLSGAYVHFSALVDEEPLNPLGWFGLSEVAWRSGDTERAVALSERGKFLQGREAGPPDAKPPAEPPPGPPQAAAEPQAPAPGFVPYVPREIRTPRYILVVALPALFCCCLGGASCLGLFNRLLSAIKDSAASGASRAPQREPQRPEGGLPERTAVYVDELNLGIDVPSEIAFNRTVSSRGAVQRVEFRHPSEANVFVRVELSPPGGPTPGEAVRDLSARFAKAYPGRCVQQRLDTSGTRARWEFDQRDSGGFWLYKCDEFAVLEDGRNAAVMLVLPSRVDHPYLAVKDRVLGSAESGVQDPGEGGP